MTGRHRPGLTVQPMTVPVERLLGRGATVTAIGAAVTRAYTPVAVSIDLGVRSPQPQRAPRPAAGRRVGRAAPAPLGDRDAGRDVAVDVEHAARLGLAGHQPPSRPNAR